MSPAIASLSRRLFPKRKRKHGATMTRGAAANFARQNPPEENSCRGNNDCRGAGRAPGGALTMPTLWFWIVAAMVTAYVVLDGFDLGAGTIYLAIAKTDEERRRMLRAIGPVWDGNELWLIAAASTLHFAFPEFC